MNKVCIIKNLSELKDFSKSLLGALNNNESNQAKVIALSGNLGAGKTTLVQAMARELGVTEVVTSPTFTIMKVYPIPQHDFYKHLVHIDAYRIESLDELRPLRLDEILADKTNLVCIEWAERISQILPIDTIKVDIKNITAEEREITISKA